MKLKFTNGLIPVIAQDADSRRALMLAYMNKEALEKTLRTRKMHYFSRSRGRIWRKGETSGNEQQLVSFSPDCDRDALLFLVKQKGNACHTGSFSCFKPSDFTLSDLAKIIDGRKLQPARRSYTCKLLQNKTLLRAKLLEEAAELAEAFDNRRRQCVISEAADLLYHALVLLSSKGIKLSEVESELGSRAR